MNNVKLQRDPAGRTCPDCIEELQEVIPLDSNGTCHGCGSCFGEAEKALSAAPERGKDGQ